MAQKQFKIGLSNTDKQNMAQDVYERLLALTFPEYDTTTEYNVGDFVVYNDQLYKCISATSGAWDNSKWQLATLNDLLTDIENAVAFVNDKANVDGNYPTMTVGAADNLTPYDEDSGTDQEQPFLLQGTGCGNGEQQVDTGALGLLKEKQGNTVVVNQLVNTGTTNISTTSGHKYWCYINGSYSIVTSTGTDIIINDDSVDKVIDLTQWFGSNDNIPSHLLAHPEDFFRYYQGSLAYNEGTLVNSNGRYIKCIGRQQWDEQWEEGSIDQAGDVIAGSAIHSKNLIKVIPNTDYYFKVGTGGYLIIDWFDKDGNNVGYLFGYGRNDHYKAPANAVSMKFAVVSDYGTTYNNDITISLYYDGESGYDQYYPYEELANIDTGTETLRSAGSVKDVKLPSGEINRNVKQSQLGALVDTVALNDYYTNLLGVNVYSFSKFTDAKDYGAYTTKIIADKITCELYKGQSYAGQYIFGEANEYSYMAVLPNMDLNAAKTFLASLTFNYELATPTTEQGTPFSENVTIDDFGSMDFGGTNGVPQGANIFYAVDYKAFIDSLYNTLDGDATGIVKDSELDSKLATLGYVKLTSVSGYDATKTQTLKNVEGTLTWVDDE